MINLRPQDKQAIIDIARQTLPANAQLLAYGSRVNGTSHDTSDLDLAIKTPTDAPLKSSQFVKFRDALQDSTIPILIQVMDWHKIPTTFQQNINANYKVLWAGG